MGTAVRSAPGSKTDRTMSKLAALKAELEQALVKPTKQHKRGKSKSARKRAAAAATKVDSGATKPGSRPTLNTGGIQVSPPQVRVTRPKGMRLQPFSDFIPRTPADYATLDPHWSSGSPKRDSMAYERAGKLVRSTREIKGMRADGTSGAEDFQTYGNRHEDDVATGVFRDGLGRVIRTTTMDDCEVMHVSKTVTVKNSRGIVVEQQVDYLTRVSGMTPREHATSKNILGVRTSGSMRKEAAEQKRAAHKAGVEERKAERAEKRDMRDQAKASRALERAENSEARKANMESNKKMRDLARDILAKQGIDKPSAIQIRGMLEFFATNMQRAEYIAAKVAQSDLAVAA